MHLIVMPRGAGKTTAMLRWASQPEEPGTPRYLCVADTWRARELVDRAEALGLSIRFPVTFDEILNRTSAGRRLELGIDDAEELIAWVMRPQQVTVVSLTSPGPAAVGEWTETILGPVFEPPRCPSASTVTGEECVQDNGHKGLHFNEYRTQEWIDPLLDDFPNGVIVHGLDQP